jgi:hypothetical protein
MNALLVKGKKKRFVVVTANTVPHRSVATNLRLIRMGLGFGDSVE